MNVGVGYSAPQLALPDQDGDEVTVPVPGSPAVLVFYRGDW